MADGRQLHPFDVSLEHSYNPPVAPGIDPGAFALAGDEPIINDRDVPDTCRYKR